MELKDGIILINKEANMTSHDVVFKLRKILKTSRIGHTGTLDPNATGVLVILLNKACKLLPYLNDTDKEYIATLQLGCSTTTDDIWGDTIDKKSITKISNFQDELDKFKGKIKQLPPMVSSVRVNGKKLYEYARENKTVERPLRDVEIHNINVIDEEELKFSVHCSSGTYIRSLCVDIANNTDNLGCMSSLVRTKVGRFTLNDCYSLDDIRNNNYEVLPSAHILDHLTKVEYKDIDEVYHGKIITLDVNSDRVLITHNDELIAIYDRYNDKQFKSVRGLW